MVQTDQQQEKVDMTAQSLITNPKSLGRWLFKKNADSKCVQVDKETWKLETDGFSFFDKESFLRK